MDETPQQSAWAWQLLRQHFGRIVAAAILIVATYSAMSFYNSYQREKELVRKIYAIGGEASYFYHEPSWIPPLISGRMRLLEHLHIVDINLNGKAVSSEFLHEFASLNFLESFDLSGTQISDTGLDHLKNLTNLKKLTLHETRTTSQGRAMLRKALPNCNIEPNP